MFSMFKDLIATWASSSEIWSMAKNDDIRLSAAVFSATSVTDDFEIMKEGFVFSSGWIFDAHDSAMTLAVWMLCNEVSLLISNLWFWSWIPNECLSFIISTCSLINSLFFAFNPFTCLVRLSFCYQISQFAIRPRKNFYLCVQGSQVFADILWKALPLYHW